MITQLLRNGNALKYSVKSKVRDGTTIRYVLDFTYLGTHFGISLGSDAFFMHYNKFEKKWGIVKCRTGKYKLLSDKEIYFPQTPMYLLLPEDVSPEALIRGVLLYEDTPSNTTMNPPELPKVISEPIKEEDVNQEGTNLVSSEI